jgi:hypothetical protein
MSIFWNKLGLLVAGASLSVASFFTGIAAHFVPVGNLPQFGATVSFNPIQAAPTFLSGAGVTAAATSVTLTSFVTRQGTLITTTNIGGIGYATIDPGTSKEENISFTGITQNGNGTAALTGVTRGLLPVFPYTASTTLAIAHSGGATVITSNSAPFYSQFNIAANTSTITGPWTFSSSSIPQLASDTTNVQVGASLFNIPDVNYVNNVASSGAANGSLSVKGIFQEATKAQTSAGTAAGSTGADLIVPNSYHSATASATTTVPVTGAAGTLSSGFIDQTANYSWTGSTTLASTSFSTATSGLALLGSVGHLSSLTAGATNTVAISNGSTWTASTNTLPIKSTTSATSSLVQNTLSTTTQITMPVAVAGSYYLFTIDTNGMVAASTTYNIILGGTTVATCQNSSLTDFAVTGSITVTSSTAKEDVSTFSPLSSCNTTDPFTVDMTASPILSLRILYAGSTQNVNNNATVVFFQ